MIGPRWSSIYKNLSNSSISYSMWYGSSLYTVLAEQLRKCSLCIKHYKPHSLSCEGRKLLRVTLADSTTCSCLTPQWRSNHDDDPQTIQLELCQLPTLSTRFIASSPYTAPVLAWDFGVLLYSITLFLLASHHICNLPSQVNTFWEFSLYGSLQKKTRLQSYKCWRVKRQRATPPPALVGSVVLPLNQITIPNWVRWIWPEPDRTQEKSQYELNNFKAKIPMNQFP